MPAVASARLSRTIRQLSTSSGALALADQSIVSGTNFLIALMVARTCSTAEFGTYVLMLSVVALLIDLQGSLVSIPHTLGVSTLVGEQRAVFTGSTFLHHVAIAVTTMSGVALWALWRGTGSTTELKVAVGALAATTGAMLFREYIRRVAFALDRMRDAVALDSAAAVLQLMGFGLLVSARAVSARNALLVTALSAAAAAGGWLMARRGEFRFDVDAGLRVWKQNWLIGRWALPGSLVWTLNTSAYLWLLTHFHGASETAAWAACMGLVSVLNPILLGVQNWLTTQTARSQASGGAEAVASCVKKAAVTLCAGMLPPILVLAVWAPELLAGLYGPAYATHARAVWPLALLLLLSAIGFAASRGLFAIGRARLDSAINVVTLLLSLTVGAVLTAVNGVFGAACGLALSGAVALGARYLLLLRAART